MFQYKEDLSSDEEIFAEKTKEIESLKGHIRELEEEKVALSNQLQETLIRVKKHEDQLFQQQLQLNHFLLSQGRGTWTSCVYYFMNTVACTCIQWNPEFSNKFGKSKFVYITGKFDPE